MSQNSAPKNSEQRTPTNSLRRRQAITETPPSHKLESALWHLNHTAQYDLFQHLIKTSGNVVGFRIKTSKKESQKISLFWLMKSLLKSRDRKSFSFDLDSWLDSENDFNHFLLHTICPKFGITIKPDLSKEENSKVLIRTVAERIYFKIKKENQDIILIFSGIDSRPESFLKKLEDLWENLVNLKINQNNPHYLLTFWIDFQSSQNDWRDSDSNRFLEQVTPGYKPYSLFNLNVANKFKLDELRSWVKSSHENRLAEIKYQLVVDDTERKNTITSIWQDSEKGKPKALLKAVYKKCEICWEEHESKWQTFH